MTSLGNALKSCFDLLNVNRMQSGIDTYGQVNVQHHHIIFKSLTVRRNQRLVFLLEGKSP